MKAGMKMGQRRHPRPSTGTSPSARRLPKPPQPQPSHSSPAHAERDERKEDDDDEAKDTLAGPRPFSPLLPAPTSSSPTSLSPSPPPSSRCWISLSPPLHPCLLHVLLDVLRFPQMTPVQATTIPLLTSHKDVVVQAITGSGKCFARGTFLRLMNGERIAVENVAGGEQLMGDDGLPRIVTPGSLTQGHDTLYRITPRWDGAQPFTVNGAHILVLVNNQKPHIRRRSGGRGWDAVEWQVSTDNRMVQRSTNYGTEAEAQAAVDALFTAGWEPPMWEPSVNQFLATGVVAARQSKLIACKAITFNNLQLPSLYQVLTVVLGAVPTPAQVDYMAWWLGMWVTDGDPSQPRICQGGAPPPDPHHHYQIFARLRDYQQLFNQPVTRTGGRLSNAGWPVYCFQYHAGSVADNVLRAYGLLNNKEIPRALICDSLNVRRRLLAGIIDGDGYYDPGNGYEVAAKHRRVIKGYKELAATLGLRNSVIADKECTNQQTGDVYRGHRMNISGDMWDAVQYCAATYKRCPQPGTAGYVEKNKDPRCYGFDITELPAGDFFGFAVHGGVNRRFLLEDYTVTHNTLAFILPLLSLLLRLPSLPPAHHTLALIISPTRELALQTAATLATFLPHLPLPFTSSTLIGGSSSLTLPPPTPSHIITATPGRLSHALTTLHTSSLLLLILDEADRLLSDAFATSLATILPHLPKQRRTGLFSATQTRQVHELVRAGLRNPVVVDVQVQWKGSAGAGGGGGEAVGPGGGGRKKDGAKQGSTGLIPAGGQVTPVGLRNWVRVMKAEEKVAYLANFLLHHAESKVIVFFLTCACVEYFHQVLSSLPALSPLTLHALHGQLVQKRRTATLAAFTSSSASVLLCTDVAARGVDIPHVHCIVQFDAPLDPAVFIHRIGRTARMGREGESLLLLAEEEDAYVAYLQRLHVPIEPYPDLPPSFPPPTTPTPHAPTPHPFSPSSLTTTIRALALSDRLLFERGQAALVSYTRAYREHQLHLLFPFAKADWAGVARGYGLVMFPVMADLKWLNVRYEGVEGVRGVDIEYKDRAREERRKERMKAEGERREREKREREEEERQQRKRKAELRSSAAIKKQRKAKRPHARLEQEWTELQAEARLLKKLRQKKITQQQFDDMLTGRGEGEAEDSEEGEEEDGGHDDDEEA